MATTSSSSSTMPSPAATTTTTSRIINKYEMKRADQRSSITIVVLGDEGVGKSSLISTFISRYFSEVVPGIMTRVRLPPDPYSSCITTIVDSQLGDTALLHHQYQYHQHATTTTTKSQVPLSSPSQPPNSISKQQPPLRSSTSDISLPTIEQRNQSISSTKQQQQQHPIETTTVVPPTTTTNTKNSSSNEPIIMHRNNLMMLDHIDSIILVYDLDRIETFYRLENHWLPLIGRCYHGKVPVIVAENKLDLFRPSSSTTTSRMYSSNSNISSSTTTTSIPTGTTTTTLTDDQILARKRQQIVSLMQRFPFIRQCIKCSAKNLLRVDDVFLKAQQAVLYPFVPPLYDLEIGQLTMECKRAFTRIFRMYDKDYDGLLSDMELDRFQRDTYQYAIVDRDLAAWKKVVTRNNPSETDERVLQDGKFTLLGFFTIFDVFISQNRLDVVWQALRKFNYDDDLHLHVPESIIYPEDDIITGATPATISSSSLWRLSSAAKKFLTNLFRQFDSDHDGYLSPEDVVTMFSILPPPALPPWHPMRASELFEGCFSLPKESPTNGSSSGTDSPDEMGGDTSLIVPSASMVTMQQQEHSILSTSGVSILSASDSLPSVDVGGIYPLSKSLSYLEWMGHWYAISVISPAITRAELYRLGHVEDYQRKKRHTSDRRRSKRRSIYSRLKKDLDDALDEHDNIGLSKNIDVYYDTKLPSRQIRVTVFGRRGSGKTALLNALCGTFDGLYNCVRAVDTTSTTHPETSTTYVKLKRNITTTGPATGGDRNKDELVVHLVFTDVPESTVMRQEEHFRQLHELFGQATLSTKEQFCDLAMLVFDCTDPQSLAFVKEMETKLLSKDTPRVFIGTKSDLFIPPESEDGDARPATVLDDAVVHCRTCDLESPLVTSAIESINGVGGIDRKNILDHIARCAIDDDTGIHHLKAKPHEAEKRREAARRRKMMWLGGIVSVGVVVAVGVGLLWSASSSAAASAAAGAAKKDQKSSFSWLRSFFGSGLRISKNIPRSG